VLIVGIYSKCHTRKYWTVVHHLKLSITKYV